MAPEIHRRSRPAAPRMISQQTRSNMKENVERRETCPALFLRNPINKNKENLKMEKGNC